MIFNLKNTVSQFKRLIGRKFSDPIVAEERKRQTCVLVEQPGNSIGVKVILGTAFVSQQRWMLTFILVCCFSFKRCMKNHVINLTNLIFEVLPDICSVGYQEKKKRKKWKESNFRSIFVLNEKCFPEIWSSVIFDLFVTFLRNIIFRFNICNSYF